MFSLFFGNVWSISSTVFLLAIFGYIVLTIIKRKEYEFWGRKTLILFLIGLVLCCLAVMRDDYVVAVQGGTGLFALDSIQIRLAYIGGAVIGFSALSSIFVRNQKYRKAMFYAMSTSIVFKALVIEISRIVMVGA